MTVGPVVTGEQSLMSTVVQSVCVSVCVLFVCYGVSVTMGSSCQCVIVCVPTRESQECVRFIKN